MSIINLDVDGVVCDFAPHMFDTLRKDGFDVDALPPEVYSVWDFFSPMPKDMKEHAFTLLADKDYWLSIGTVPGAKEGVEAIRAAGHRIHWITTSWPGCFGWADIRKTWLDANFHHPDQDLSKDLTIAGDKSFSDGDVFVDDKASSVRGWLDHFKYRKHEGVLFANSHNLPEQRDFKYVSSWEEGLTNLVILLADER